MTLTRITLALLVLAGLLPAAHAQPLSVHVMASEVGQGILLHRLGSCYAVTPAHVLKDELFASVVGGLSEAPRGDADVLMEFGYDLSIMRVSGGVTRYCDEPLRRTGDVSALLASASRGFIHTVRRDGSVARQEVALVDSDMLYLRVKPPAGGEPLAKGMSGSLVYVNDTPAGMLMSVEGETGTGRVLRYDRLTETVAPFFSRGGGATEERPEAPASDSPATAVPSVTAEAVNWSAAPLTPEHRASNVLDSNPQQVWLARLEGFPVDIEVRLSAGQSVALNGIRLVTAGIENRKQTPKDYELMVSSKAAGENWLPLRSGTLFMRDEQTDIAFAPVKARRLLLRIHSNWGDTEAVGLAGLVIR